MTFSQVSILALLVGVLVVMATGRHRVEIVALAGLAIGVAVGLVPTERVFAGFSNPAVITVVEILLIVQVLGKAGVVNRLGALLADRLDTPRKAMAALVIGAAVLSMFMNNIGAFALMLPLVTATAYRIGLTLRAVIMPVAFATLLGGLCTATGTPANLVASDVLRRATGEGLGYLAFAPVGLAVAVLGLAMLLWRAPVVLGLRAESPSSDSMRRVVTAVRITHASPLSGATVSSLAPQVEIRSLQRDGSTLTPLWPRTVLEPGDVAMIETTLAVLDRHLEANALALAGDGPLVDVAERVEAAVMPGSVLLGSPVAALGFLEAIGARLVAVHCAEPGRRVDGEFDELRLRIGDVIHVAGPHALVESALRERDLAILAGVGRRPATGSSWPVGVFFGGVALAGFGLAEPALAFGAVVLALALWGVLRLSSTLRQIDWSVVLMLGAMVPLGEAVASTGAATALAAAVIAPLPASGPWAVAAMLLLAMAITPFVNNTATVVVLAPIAVEVAAALALPAAPLLIAVAVGASLDFLTPFGHHNNTLALGLGGYRFGDFARLGWPLALVGAVIGTLATVQFWLH